MLPLHETPLGDYLCTTEEQAKGLQCFPLDVASCRDCRHLFLPAVVSPQESYDNYHFRTSRSPGLSESMKLIAEELWLTDGMRQGDLVLDIGSNDGSWLSHFQSLGASVLGVEPSEAHASSSVSRGIPTLNEYFGGHLVGQISREMRQPSLISANYVMANLPDPMDSFAAIADLAGPDTRVSILTGYHPDQFRFNMFDFVYHEHLSYFSAADFHAIAERFGFVVESVKRVSLKGGSLLVLLRKSDNQDHSPDFYRLIQQERWIGIDRVDFYTDMLQHVSSAFEETRDFLSDFGPEETFGYGFSHSVTTLLYQSGLMSSISMLVDDNPDRQGLYAPGSGLRIQPLVAAQQERFRVAVILAWQHDSVIRQKLRNMKWSGGVCQPLPWAWSSHHGSQL